MASHVPYYIQHVMYSRIPKVSLEPSIKTHHRKCTRATWGTHNPTSHNTRATLFEEWKSGPFWWLLSWGLKMHRGQLERLTCHKFYEQIHPQAELACLCISPDTILRGVSKRRRTLHKTPPHTECSGCQRIHWSHCDYIRLQFICFCVCTCTVSRKSC